MEKRAPYKVYKPGDQIHISVTKDFAEIATEFFKFCRENHFNPSDVMRGSIAYWLKKQKEMQKAYNESKLSKEGMMDKIIENFEKSILSEEEK